jgi:hypothetical protein
MNALLVMGFLLPWVRQCSDSQRRQNGGEEEVGEKKKRRMETSRANERESEGVNGAPSAFRP